MNLDELNDRLRVFDGHVPRREIIAALTAGEEAVSTAQTWRAVAAASMGVALAFGLFGTYMHTKAMTNLRLVEHYEGRCLEPEIGERILATSERLVEANYTSLRLNERVKLQPLQLFSTSSGLIDVNNVVAPKETLTPYITTLLRGDSFNADSE